MTDFVALAHSHWLGQADLVHQHHPVQTTYTDCQEIADGLLYFKSTAGFAVVDTGAGLVMVDAGSRRVIDSVYEAVRAWRPETPLVAATFSHHHTDHVWCTRRFDEEAQQRGWSPPVVYSHSLLPEHFERYRKTQGWNKAINRRQFLARDKDLSWAVDFRFPDVTFDRDLTVKIGNLTFEMHHARGETDDHVWIWVPERRWLFPGDLFIWAVPNAGNPQKVQRYCAEWGHALRKMAALRPDVLVAGHGLPIFGPQRTCAALLDTAEYLESIEAQTIALMNQGLPLDEVIHRVVPLAHLADRPYLQPVYDHPQFLVRNVWRRFGGWWDGEPDTLLPAPRADQAKEWIGLSGGVGRVLERVAALEADGDLRMACHLVELAMLAEPGCASAHAARSRIYAARAAEQMSSMARGIFTNASESSAVNRRDRCAVDAPAPAERAQDLSPMLARRTGTNDERP